MAWTLLLLLLLLLLLFEPCMGRATDGPAGES
jgi:hypothetical protein